MNANEVAAIGFDMVSSASLGALTGGFLHRARRAAGLSAAFCYLCDATRERLIPLVGDTTSLDGWPDICMEELENPLVYSLLKRKACQVEDINRLVAVGKGFELLRERLPACPSLLAIPLLDARGRALGVLVVTAGADVLRGWRSDPVWQLLVDTHERLFARLGSELDAAARNGRAERQKLEPDEGQSRAARLLASGFVGTSPAAQRIRAEMLRLAESSLSTLITGETGSGKDHAAWLIHQASSRGGQFVPVNCAAISAELIEAELFGSVKGAFTGATQSRNGLVAEADGGTLFLDEIGDMPMPLQATLLRVLNEKRYRPVGATKERESNFRLICATHQPLPQMIREGRFREDLYFRIRQTTLALPPLRERAEDIPALATHALFQYNREQQSHVSGFDAQALAWLKLQPFPGNVRELRNLVMAASEQARSNGMIGLEIVRALMNSLEVISVPDDAERGVQGLLAMDDLPAAMEAFERLLISRRLKLSEGSRTRTAQSLGIPKRTLARKCRKWKLDQEINAS
ncbi:sigma-54 dependent transcriptional regulator [Paraburkholderia tropica]|uniref:sigma-54 dependent transcriptional regulator n=1 Tax=Paraburkholderia tropica TaxID=92647 RepID=UPI002AB7D343|nr:sigma-54 dependent transcriptional regulator [Paraburkholderia tropica]